MTRLRELRLKMGVKQTKLAEVIGKSFQAYSHYETGDREADYHSLIAIAEFYNVSVDYILGRDVTPKNETNITTEEQEILDNYNYLTPADRQYIRGLIAGMARQNKKDSHRNVTATMIAG